MSDNNSGKGWLIAAALVGAAVAGSKANKKKKKAEQERLEREHQENETSSNNVLGNILNSVFNVITDAVCYYSDKADEAKEQAQSIASSASDAQLKKWVNGDNSFLKEAALEELENRKSAYGLKKFKAYR